MRKPTRTSVDERGAQLASSRMTSSASNPPPTELMSGALRHTGPENRHAAALEQLAALRASGPSSTPLELAGARLVGQDFAGLDLARADLSGADLSRANMVGTNLFGAKLVGTTLFEADLTGAELTGADLSRANLEAACLARTGLGLANLRDARLPRADLTGATLSDAVLANTNLQAARLDGARARGADLTGADLGRCSLNKAELDGVCVAGANFGGADLRGASLAGIRGFELAQWLGVDLRDVDFAGAWRCRSFIQDENYLAEFRAQSRWNHAVYVVWKLTSDCGRSAGRWAIACGLVTLFFAWLNTLVGVDYGRYPTAISPLYYSVVTIATLGFGDAVPATLAGQIVAMAAVISGYVMLGGLLTILSNKMARRAG